MLSQKDRVRVQVGDQLWDEFGMSFDYSFWNKAAPQFQVQNNISHVVKREVDTRLHNHIFQEAMRNA